ncbi:glycoside hydrolase family 73 protein [Paenibacillus sp. R14(2021)]|uniref:glycoside hydrolase family 73 protein n=1 Tax=Paenibacillus sp. R14(2021) TaxID=2859228 RepID=UPI001C614B33|nr:glucosaminidase domain-containing protein [Paenibacillus sp. R14(2021)]
MNRQAFFEMLIPIVKQLQAEGSPLFPSVRLAQSWLETGGNIPYWNNLGGYKPGSGVPNGYWKGTVVNKRTWEVIDGKRITVVTAFRAYDSIYDFYKDQDLLFAGKRYAAVRSAGTPVEQARMLQASGYATDPDYADKIIQILNASGLMRYDLRAEEEEPMTADEKKAFDELKAAVSSLAADNEALRSDLDSQLITIQALQVQAIQLEALHKLDVIPAWAKEAMDSAVSKHLLDSPKNGSYDFYRMMTVLHRAKLL